MSRSFRGLEWIYYCDDNRGRIKIGYSLNPHARIAEFRTVNPEIELIAMESGLRELERVRHSQFHEERIGGEWFIKSERLEQWMDLLECLAWIEAGFTARRQKEPGGMKIYHRDWCCKNEWPS